jgi:hypothetical protein
MNIDGPELHPGASSARPRTGSPGDVDDAALEALLALNDDQPW